MLTAVSGEDPSPGNPRACDEISRSIHLTYATLISPLHSELIPAPHLDELLPFCPRRADTCTPVEKLLEDYRARCGVGWTATEIPLEIWLEWAYSALEMYPVLVTAARDDRERSNLHSEIIAAGSSLDMSVDNLGVSALPVQFARLVHALDIMRQTNSPRYADVPVHEWQEALEYTARGAHESFARYNDKSLNADPALFQKVDAALDILRAKIPDLAPWIKHFRALLSDSTGVHHDEGLTHFGLAALARIGITGDELSAMREEFLIKGPEEVTCCSRLREAIEPLADEREWLSPHLYLLERASQSKVMEFRCSTRRVIGDASAPAIAQAAYLTESGFRDWWVVYPNLVSHVAENMRLAGIGQSPAEVMTSLNKYIASPRHRITEGLVSYLGFIDGPPTPWLINSVRVVDELHAAREKHKVRITLVWPEMEEENYFKYFTLPLESARSIVFAHDTSAAGVYPGVAADELTAISVQGAWKPNAEEFTWPSAISNAIFSAAEATGWAAEFAVGIKHELLSNALTKFDFGNESLDMDIWVQGFRARVKPSLHLFLRAGGGPDDDDRRGRRRSPTPNPSTLIGV